MTCNMLPWRILDVANGTKRSNTLFLWLQLGQSTFLLKQILVCEHFVKFGMAESNMLDDLVAVRVGVVAESTCLK